jgi:mannose-6-phosphate isomerase
VNPEPLRIEPIFSPRIWGARSLAPLFPEKSDLSPPLGEAWLTGFACRIASGPLKGKTLGEAWQEMPAAWRGTTQRATPEFPLLLKFIFPTDKLSIQVHPDDAYASVHEREAGGRGKTEMWYVVSAEPDARVYVGLKSGVDKQAFLDGLRKNTLESLLQAHTIRAGDTIFIPAGTPHFIGPGMILFEVQEYSDLTYRIYDFGRVDAQGRLRDLHIDKALQVINFGVTSARKTDILSLPAEDLERSLLAACRYFAAEQWQPVGPFVMKTDPAHFDLLVSVSADGFLNAQGVRFPCRRGDCWFLPANLGEYNFLPLEQPATLLRTYPPELEVLRAELLEAGHAKTVARGAVFD